MQIKFDLGLSEKENPEKSSYQEIFYSWIQYAINASHEKGLQGQMLRVFNRLNTKFQNAITDNLDKIDLEESEKDLLKKSFSDDTFFPLNSSKVVILIMQEIELFNKKD